MPAHTRLTVERALNDEARRLRASSQSPRLDAELLLAHVLGITRERLYAAPERVLIADERSRFESLVERRAAGEPVAYLTGHKAFRALDLRVGPEALVPRPETETLVEVALAKLALVDWERIDRRPRVLDLGTGSGAVALALVHEHPSVQVVATDVDERALELARLNAVRLGLGARIEFAHGDLFDGLPGGALFDLIVSNPPYVAEHELPGLPVDVRDYEPVGALVAGPQGLDVYERLVPAAPPFLRTAGWLAVEIAEMRSREVLDIFSATGRFEPVELHDDLSGRPRVVAGRERTYVHEGRA